ncbi:hypothetical protein [Cytobacillus sp.]|uniref:hypothetical protein n=1 Tax=Cytobacillus sp. TaxID=2675269 RepID=UPI0028BECD15|nr:hypothetical protein [Cytobacillus sp.]
MSLNMEQISVKRKDVLLLVIGIMLFASTLRVPLTSISSFSFGNVLLPSLIKMNFPFKVGLMTGLYALFKNAFGALASGLSVPISKIGSFG